MDAHVFADYSSAHRPHLISKLLSGLSAEEQQHLLYHWPFWARPNQLPPTGDWTHWLVLAGRGFGKTRTGAEWVRHLAESGAAKRIALLAPTAADAREVMIEGESGLLAVSNPLFRPVYEPSKRRLRWPNGAIATAYSADEPERLRGPQHDAAWCDELCAWRFADQAFDMLMFGLRLGTCPRSIITTTPKPTALLKRLLADPRVHLTKGSTYDNLANLAPTFKNTVLQQYEGTRLGRQELLADVLEDMPGALWQRALINSARRPAGSVPQFDRIVVAIDPPASASGDECGMIVAARKADRFFVLDDISAGGLSPQAWATQAVRAYHSYQADRMIAEANQGGDMVRAVLEQVDAGLPIKLVHASRGKVARAEPIAALYEQGRVSHLGQFERLEDQMCAFSASFDRHAMGYSPDRVDALVWALTDLLAKRPLGPQLRNI